MNQESLIDETLRTYPLAEMPHSITANIMAHIKKETRPALITWNDFALSFVVASIIASLWFTVINLPPIFVAKLRIQWILLYQSFLVNADWLIPAILFSISAMMFAYVTPYLIQSLKRL